MAGHGPDALAVALTRALDRDPSVRFDTTRQLGSAVLDATARVKRPWTQGEIGDFLRLHFAQDLAQRGAQIASAVETSGGRAAMPLITQPEDEATAALDDAEEFPPAGAEISETPVDVRHLRGPSSERAAVDEPSDPGLGLGTPRATAGMVAQQPQPIVVVNQKRSLLWPLVAIAMLAVAGGALFLVWRQMQIQQPPSLVITHDQGTQVAEGGSNLIIVGARPAEPEGPGSAAERAGAGRASRRRRPATGWAGRPRCIAIRGRTRRSGGLR